MKKFWIPYFSSYQRPWKTVFLIGSLWTIFMVIRPWTIQPRCSSPSLSSCLSSSLLEVDRLSLGLQSLFANQASDWLQYGVGLLALVSPFLWNGILLVYRIFPSSLLISSCFSEILLILETIFWNGLLKEVLHIIIRRPRPLVYLHYQQMNAMSQNYTSFYSGHTSFVSACVYSVFFILWRRQAPPSILIGFLSLAQVFVFATGYFRIIAGRHFLTDVLVGAFMGCALAGKVIFYRFQRDKGLKK